MVKKRAPTTDAVEILHRRYYEGHPERLAMLEEERANNELARQIYDLRNKAGLSQGQLAKRVGTTATVIDDLEESDYDGNAFAMFSRIVAALDHRFVIRVVPLKRRSRSA